MCVSESAPIDTLQLQKRNWACICCQDKPLYIDNVNCVWREKSTKFGLFACWYKTGAIFHCNRWSVLSKWKKVFFLFSTLSWYSITLHGIYNILSHYNVTPLYSHRASNVSKIALKRVELNENKEEKKCLRLSGSDLSLSLTLSLHIGCKCVFCCCFFLGNFVSEVKRIV